MRAGVGAATNREPEPVHTLRLPPPRALSALALIAAPVAAGARGHPQPQRLWHVFPLNGQATVTAPATSSKPRAIAPQTATALTSTNRARPAHVPNVATPPAGHSARSSGSSWGHWQWLAVGFVCLQLVAGVAWWGYRRRNHLRLRVSFDLTSRVKRLARWLNDFGASRLARLTVWSDRFAHRGRAFRAHAERFMSAQQWRGLRSRAEAGIEAVRGLLSAINRIRSDVAARLARADHPAAEPVLRWQDGPLPSDDPEWDAVAAEPEPTVASEGGEVGAYAAETSGPGSGDADDLVGVLHRRIEEARSAHRALAVVGARLAKTRGDPGIDPHQLKHYAELAAGDAIGAQTSADFSVDREERSVWLVLPGVLPRRAAGIARRLEELLESAGIPVVRTSALGYPRDADCAEALGVRCHELIATFRGHEDDPSARDDDVHAKHSTIDRLTGVLVATTGSRRLDRRSGLTLDVPTFLTWKRKKPAAPAARNRVRAQSRWSLDRSAATRGDAGEGGSSALEDRHHRDGVAALGACLGRELEAAREGHHALSLAALRVPAGQQLGLARVAEAERKAEIRALEKFEIALENENDLLLLVVLPGLRPKRACELADTLRAALDPNGQTEAPVVVGYPNDGATAAALLDACLALARARRLPLAEA
jgi:hypothetical protein